MSVKSGTILSEITNLGMTIDRDKYWVFVSPKTNIPNIAKFSIEKDYTFFVLYSYSDNYTGDIPIDILIISDKLAY